VEHREALHAAMRRVYGIADPGAARVEAAGRTDVEIARHIALLSDLSAQRFDDGIGELHAVCVEEYAERAPADLSATVAPGVPALLEELSGREGHVLALLTGNLEPIARLKLDRAGLGAFFARGQGAFGSDDEDRAALPAIARGRAGSGDEPYPRRGTVVIGDTPRDIACAHGDGVRCVAVATGPYPPEALSAADAVARDAAGLAELL
jgi:phosphoglycolate phosphatase